MTLSTLFNRVPINSSDAVPLPVQSSIDSSGLYNILLDEDLPNNQYMFGTKSESMFYSEINDPLESNPVTTTRHSFARLNPQSEIKSSSTWTSNFAQFGSNTNPLFSPSSTINTIDRLKEHFDWLVLVIYEELIDFQCLSIKSVIVRQVFTEESIYVEIVDRIIEQWIVDWLEQVIVMFSLLLSLFIVLSNILSNSRSILFDN